MDLNWIAIAGIIFGSVGFWNFLQSIYLRKTDKKSWIVKGVLAVLHSLLYDLCDDIIIRGYKTPKDVEELAYLTKPYLALGGDGTVEEMLKIIEKYEVKPR